jgi:hypothetical protein
VIAAIRSWDRRICPVHIFGFVLFAFAITMGTGSHTLTIDVRGLPGLLRSFWLRILCQVLLSLFAFVRVSANTITNDSVSAII